MIIYTKVSMVYSSQPIKSIRRGPDFEKDKNDTITEYEPERWYVVFSFGPIAFCFEEKPDFKVGDEIEIKINKRTTWGWHD